MTQVNRWGWMVSLVALTAAGLVLFFLLSIATGNRAAYETYYVWLFWVNVAVALLLLVVILVAVVRLQLRVRGGRFGSRLLLRLVGIFAFVGVVPGVLIYTVSYQFVSRSIESWFDVKVEGALDAGLNLGRDTIEAQVKELGARPCSPPSAWAKAGHRSSRWRWSGCASSSRRATWRSSAPTDRSCSPRAACQPL